MRIIKTSARGLEFGVAAISAIALALAFPKAGQAWLAPFGAAGLFWVWQRVSLKRAFWTGWFAGTIFMAITFSWIVYTIGSALGNLSFAVVAIVALVEGIFFALAGSAAALAYRYVHPSFAPLAAACAFVVFEWARSVGELGVPFEQLGYSQADSPLAIFAAYAGTFGVTFVLCVFGAYLARAVATGRNRALLVTVLAIVLAWIAAWAAWPARYAAPPNVRVAAIQGNIAQSLKMEPGSTKTAIARYLALTARARGFSPRLVLWPETVVNEFLIADPGSSARFAALARDLHATLVIGAWDEHDAKAYNALYVFGPQGQRAGIYDKRQLVPFAESFPGRGLLAWLPDVSLIGRWSHGHADAVISGPLAFAPLICWESAFADLAHAQVRNGAQLFLVATDDAWFGDTSGPYQHAQIAQMRAIENGTWVIRAASTGISGIISPSGRYVERSDLDREAVVMGLVGVPSGSLFAHIGPTPVVATLFALYLALLAGALALRRRARHA
ncbi:MAG TPA: apolipoprotein N-acyltransferase [Candidatus Baltobacteraceae bacterium]